MRKLQNGLWATKFLGMQLLDRGELKELLPTLGDLAIVRDILGNVREVSYILSVCS